MKKNSAVKDWTIAIVACVGMLVAMALVGYGAYCLLVDTARAIIHP